MESNIYRRCENSVCTPLNLFDSKPFKLYKEKIHQVSILTKQ